MADLDGDVVVEERVVVLTGAAGGLGSHVLARLSARGARVVAVDLDGPGLESAKTAAGGSDRVVTFVGDVTDSDSVRSFVKLAEAEWGRLDAIHNNAAIQGLVGPFVDYPEEELWRVMRTNFLSAWLGMQHAIPILKRGGGGVILNTGSTLAFRAWREVPAYVASKHALAGLTKTVALEYAKDNIRANLLCPSAMETPMLNATAANMADGDVEAGLRMMREMSPSGRLAQPKDVADIAVWLLLDAPAHMSGATVSVDAAETVI